MKIIADGFGGDNAPLSVLEGCAAAVKEYGVEILLTGDEKVLRDTAGQNNISLAGIEIVPAEGVISMHDDPRMLLKEKSHSSMAVAFQLLKEGKGDALVSGGSTGAVVVGANFIVKRIKGIKRPGLASVIPTINGKYMLMDCGATLDCKPETLAHYGMMGSVYMKKMFGIPQPKVGLVNIGAEDTKGTALQLNAYRLMSEAPYHFVGNVEAREIPAGAVDVAVADGFTGNVVLKLTEGLASMFSKKLKDMLLAGTASKLAALLLKNGIKDFKASMDYTEYGGAPLLGVQKPVIKAHGSSNGKAFKNAIRQAMTFAESGMIEEITRTAAAMKMEASGEEEA